MTGSSARAFEPGKAGWLFADLLLVLSIVTLGAATVPDDVPLTRLQAAPAPTTTSPRPSPSPARSPGAAPPARPRQVRGLERTPLTIGFAVDTRRLVARDAGELRRVRRLLVPRTAPLRGRRAALVLTFGCDPDSRVGSTMSAVVNSQLRAADVHLFGDTVTRSFMDDSCRGTVRMEIYPFTR